MSSISPPYLHNPSLPTFCRWLTRTPTHDSSITHCDWLVPYVRASSWLVNLVVASALFVHVCCHVDVGVLCVVLVCEEHTCSLVSFVWNQLKKSVYLRYKVEIKHWRSSCLPASVYYHFPYIHQFWIPTSPGLPNFQSQDLVEPNKILLHMWQ